MAIFNWKAGVNADWNTPSAWDVGAVPDSSLADVTINAASSTVTISAPESFQVGTLELDAGTLDVAGALFVRGPPAVAGLASLSVWAGSTLTVAPTGGVDIGSSQSIVVGSVLVEAGNILAGDGTINASVVNNGAIEAANNPFGPAGRLEITGALTGTGTVQLAPGAMMQVDGSLAATESVLFTGAGPETLILNNASPSIIGSQFSGLNAGDRIEFGSGIAITSVAPTPQPTLPNEWTVTDSLNNNYTLSNLQFGLGAVNGFIPVFDSGTGMWAIQAVSPGLGWNPPPFGGTNDIGTAKNWNSLTAPSSNQALSFTNNFTIHTLTGISQGLYATFGGTLGWTLVGATLTLAGEPVGGSGSLGLIDTGTLTVSGGALSAGGSADIAGALGAAMTVQNGAQVSFKGVSVGMVPGQNGTLKVSGSGTNLADAGTLAFGSASGKGGLQIDAGATLTTDTVSVGALGSVNMTGGSLSSTLGPVTLGLGATLTGSGTVVGNIVDNLGASIEASGGVLTLSGTVSGAGQLSIGAGATLDVGTTATNEMISFLGSTGTLVDRLTGLAGASIANFGASNVIDLRSLTFTANATASFAGATGTLTVKSGVASKTIHLASPLATTTQFAVTADGAGGTAVTIALPLVLTGGAGNDTLFRRQRARCGDRGSGRGHRHRVR
jgi:T5SS/PEP-CTERM-associated repeat protein